MPRLKFITMCGTIYILCNLHMQKVLYLAYTGNFYFWNLLRGRVIDFLGLAMLFTLCLQTCFAS